MDKLFLVTATFYGVLVSEYSAVECKKIVKVVHGSMPEQRFNKNMIGVIDRYGEATRIWCEKHEVRVAIEMVRLNHAATLDKEIKSLREAREHALNGDVRFDPNYDPEEIAAKQGPVTDDMF